MYASLLHDPLLCTYVCAHLWFANKVFIIKSVMLLAATQHLHDVVHCCAQVDTGHTACDTDAHGMSALH